MTDVVRRAVHVGGSPGSPIGAARAARRVRWRVTGQRAATDADHGADHAPRPWRRPTTGTDHHDDRAGDRRPPTTTTTLPPTTTTTLAPTTIAPVPVATVPAADRSRSHRRPTTPASRSRRSDGSRSRRSASTARCTRASRSRRSTNGPGHWPGTALPGQLGNAVVAGHRTSHNRDFRNIDQLVPGDEIILSTDRAATSTGSRAPRSSSPTRSGSSTRRRRRRPRCSPATLPAPPASASSSSPTSSSDPRVALVAPIGARRSPGFGGRRSRCHRGDGGRSPSSASSAWSCSSATEPVAATRGRCCASASRFVWLAPGMAWMWFLTAPGYVVAGGDLRRLPRRAPPLVAPDGRWRGARPARRPRAGRGAAAVLPVRRRAAGHAGDQPGRRPARRRWRGSAACCSSPGCVWQLGRAARRGRSVRRRRSRRRPSRRWRLAAGRAGALAVVLALALAVVAPRGHDTAGRCASPWCRAAGRRARERSDDRYRGGRSSATSRRPARSRPVPTSIS